MSDHTMDEQYVAELLARLAAARKAQREAELVAADQASELATIAAALGDHRMSHNQAVDKIWFMNSKLVDLDRLNRAAAAAVGLSEHAPEGEILGRLAELRQILHDLVGDDALGSGGLVAAAKAKIRKLQDDQNAAEELAVALDTMHELVLSGKISLDDVRAAVMAVANKS